MSKLKKIIITILLYFTVWMVCTILFIGLFHISVINKLNVFFYRGCIFLLFCTVLAFILIIVAGVYIKRLELSLKDAFMVSGLFFGITLGWFSLIPTTVERSISVFMLSYMEENPTEDGISAEEFGDIFYEKYIQEYGAFEKRFHEQEVSGTIIPVSNEADGYVITDRGRFIVDMFRLFSELFNTEEWLVYPNEY